MVRCYATLGWPVHALSHSELDLADTNTLDARLSEHSFDLLVNTSGLTDVDYCEANPELAKIVNGTAPGILAAHCRKRRARLVQISTDYVFAGSKPGLLHEDEPTCPINVYGSTKLLGEETALAADDRTLVLRVSWLFGLEKPSFPDRIIRLALERLDVSAVDDKWSSPTYADDVCAWLAALLEHDAASGVFHMSNAGVCSWLEYGEEALRIAERLGLPIRTTTIRGHTMDGFAPFLARRPRHTALGTAKLTRVTGIEPRSWQDALEVYLRLRHAGRAI